MNTKPYTALDICNLALAKLDVSPINGIDPNSDLPQRLCYMLYHSARREVLCTHHWNFAKHEVEITSNEDFEIKNHSVPMDALRVLEVDAHDWTLNGRSIKSREKTVKVTYIADEEDVEKFEDKFVEMFATRLAMKLCLPLINSSRCHKELSEEYASLLKENY